MGKVTMALERRRETREMREAWLRRHAQSVLQMCGQTKAPIDLFQLVSDRSEIRVFAKDLRGVCDGLLRWVNSCRRFYLYYDPKPSKARFNLAHELAHFFIDEHHHAIRTGSGIHKSNKQSFIGHPRMEAEANLYAAELQVPGFLIRKQEVEPCIEDVRQIVAQYNASLPCAARKIIEQSSIPAAMIVSRDGMMSWGVWNAGLVEEGAWGVATGRQVPVLSATERAFTSDVNQVGKTHAGLWFEEVRYRMPMREEAIAIPGHRSVLTLLSQA